MCSYRTSRAAARAGFGSDSLRNRHSRLITCDISGYGEEGPTRDRKAYDLLIQCETGLASITGTPEGAALFWIATVSTATSSMRWFRELTMDCSATLTAPARLHEEAVDRVESREQEQPRRMVFRRGTFKVRSLAHGPWRLRRWAMHPWVG
jgi:CoA-transferase family III